MADAILDESYMVTAADDGGTQGAISTVAPAPPTSTASAPRVVETDAADPVRCDGHNTETSCPTGEASAAPSSCDDISGAAAGTSLSPLSSLDKQDVGGTQAAAVVAADPALLEDPAVGACPPRGESGGVAAAAPPPGPAGAVAAVVVGPPTQSEEEDEVAAPFGHAVIIEEHVKAIADEAVPPVVGSSTTASDVVYPGLVDTGVGDVAACGCQPDRVDGGGGGGLPRPAVFSNGFNVSEDSCVLNSAEARGTPFPASSPQEEYVLLQQQQREGEEQQAGVRISEDTGCAAENGRGGDKARRDEVEPIARARVSNVGSGGVAEKKSHWSDKIKPRTTLETGHLGSPSFDTAAAGAFNQHESSGDDDWPITVTGPGRPPELGGWGHVEDGGAHTVGGDADEGATEGGIAGGGGVVEVLEPTDCDFEAEHEDNGDDDDDGSGGSDDDEGDPVLFVLGDMDGEEHGGVKPLDGLPGERSLYLTGGGGDSSGDSYSWGSDAGADADEESSEDELFKDGELASPGRGVGRRSDRAVMRVDRGATDTPIPGDGDRFCVDAFGVSAEEEDEDAVFEHAWDDLMEGVVDDGVLHGHGRGGLPDPLLTDQLAEDVDADDEGEEGGGRGVSVSPRDGTGGESADSPRGQDDDRNGGGEGEGSGEEGKGTSDGDGYSDDGSYLSSSEGQPGMCVFLPAECTLLVAASCGFVFLRFTAVVFILVLSGLWIAHRRSPSFLQLLMTVNSVSSTAACACPQPLPNQALPFSFQLLFAAPFTSHADVLIASTSSISQLESFGMPTGCERQDAVPIHDCFGFSCHAVWFCLTVRHFFHKKPMLKIHLGSGIPLPPPK